MWIFTVAVLVGTAGIILQAPTLYDDREPIDYQLSNIGHDASRPGAYHGRRNRFTHRSLFHITIYKGYMEKFSMLIVVPISISKKDDEKHINKINKLICLPYF